jgi:hypothetical protein
MLYEVSAEHRWCVSTTTTKQVGKENCRQTPSCYLREACQLHGKSDTQRRPPRPHAARAQEQGMSLAELLWHLAMRSQERQDGLGSAVTIFEHALLFVHVLSVLLPTPSRFERHCHPRSTTSRRLLNSNHCTLEVKS